MKSGFVSIIGRPNAGKSTLLNRILEQKIAIVTPKAQTTRNSIIGILNMKNFQIVFVDTPGIHTSSTNLGDYMNKVAYNEAFGSDVIYYVIDVKIGLRNEDRTILDKLFKTDSKIFAVVNKIDSISNNKLIEKLSYIESAYDFAEIIPISSLKNNNVNELLKVTKKYLKGKQVYYPKDIVSPNSRDFNISEIIREKIILNIEKEIPHYSAVTIDTVNEKNKVLDIEATIVVNKESHKGIIIGKKGNMLKEINMSACRDLKKALGKKINLSLFVKVEKDWINKDKKLFDLGYFLEK